MDLPALSLRRLAATLRIARREAATSAPPPPTRADRTLQGNRPSPPRPVPGRGGGRSAPAASGSPVRTIIGSSIAGHAVGRIAQQWLISNAAAADARHTPAASDAATTPAAPALSAATMTPPYAASITAASTASRAGRLRLGKRGNPTTRCSWGWVVGVLVPVDIGRVPRAHGSTIRSSDQMPTVTPMTPPRIANGPLMPSRPSIQAPIRIGTTISAATVVVLAAHSVARASSERSSGWLVTAGYAVRSLVDRRNHPIYRAAGTVSTAASTGG